jgi:hypothetical protein
MSESIRNIANTKILLTKEEFLYYENLIKIFGNEPFIGAFQTNNHGFIVQVTPNPQKVTPIPVLYFLLNVSFNQRMRKLDGFISRVELMERKIKNMEEKLISPEKVGDVI